MKAKTAFLGALMMGLATGQMAHAQEPEYVFRVPVDLRDLPPQLTHLTVVCHLLRANGSSIADGNPSAIQVSTGSFQGIVTVNVSRPAGTTELPVSYRCDLYVQGQIEGTLRQWRGYTDNPNRLRFVGTARPANLPEILPARVGTTPVVVVSGGLAP
jgi:hypothetical protein